MLTIALVAASLAIVSAASPTPLEQRSVRIPLTRRTDTQGGLDPYHLQNILGAMVGKYTQSVDNYKQNTGVDHPMASALPGNRTMSKRAPGDEALTRQNTAFGPFWQASLIFGIATSQTLGAGVDTGSADIIVPTDACATSGCIGHTMLNPTTTGMTDLAKPFSISNGFNNNDGTFSGEQYSGPVGIASYTAAAQTFGGASSYPAAYSAANYPADGFLGLAYQSISKLNAKSLPQTLFAQGVILSDSFSLKLAATGSELEVGGTDTALYNAPLNYIGVVVPTGAVARGFWQVIMDSVTVGGKAVRGLVNLQAIFDSGSSFIYTSSRLADMVYKNIDGSERIPNTSYYSYPCSTSPAVSLTFNGRSYPITPALFNAGSVTNQAGRCVGAIAGGFSSDSYWIIGDAFLQGYYTSYDFTNNRVGIATLV